MVRPRKDVRLKIRPRVWYSIDELWERGFAVVCCTRELNRRLTSPDFRHSGVKWREMDRDKLEDNGDRRRWWTVPRRWWTVPPCYFSFSKKKWAKEAALRIQMSDAVMRLSEEGDVCQCRVRPKPSWWE